MVLRLIAAVVVPLALLLGAGGAAAHHCTTGTCADVKDRYASCHGLRKRHGYVRVARCEIRRAADHYRVSFAKMDRMARCESTYRWWLRGRHQGMYQYTWQTWRGYSPFRRRSPYSPKWASLHTAWMLRHGMAGHWACQ